MDIKTVSVNLKNLMNKWFYTREQIHQLLEDYVTVDNNGILNVGLPSAEKISLTTSNNAITTADVAEVTAKVTDSSNNATFGVPVQFVNRATREVLYNGTTDENGECDFQYFTEEAEILPIQARISNDFIFRDDGRLNSYNSWDYNNNVTIQHLSTHSIVSRADTSSSIGTLGTLLLSGYCDIDFKVKILSDGSADFLFCRIVEQTSTGQVVDNGSSNTFKLNDLNLTTEKWYNFHISVLDDRIVLHCKDTGETKRIWLDEAYPYYRFQLLPSLSVPTICFSDMKITRCSDDLSMFIKDKDNIISMNLWSGGDYLHNTTGIMSSSNRDVSVSSDWSSQGDESFLWESDSTITDLFRLPVGSYDEGTYILKMDVYSPTVSVTMIFFNSPAIQSRVTVPKSDEITPVELTLTPNDSNYYLSCRISCTGRTKFYCDNIHIIPVQ